MKKFLNIIVCFSSFLFASAQNSIKLDKSFGNNGIVVTSDKGIGNALPSMANKCFVTANGKILVVGSFGLFSGVVRRNANGSLDSTYGRHGFSTFAPIDQPTAAMQSDGKIVVAGSTGSDNDNFVAARYNTDGTIDKDFGDGGIRVVDLHSEFDVADAVAIQSDGKILIGGETFHDSYNQFGLVRLNVNGSLDRGFGEQGIVNTQFGNLSNIVSVLIQPKGKIIAVGTLVTNMGEEFAIVRYGRDGALDSSFNGTGIMIADFPSSTYVTAASLQADGKVLVGGYNFGPAGASFAVFRYTSNGLLDSSFNSTGLNIAPSGDNNDFLTSLALQSDGKIIAGGYTYVNGIANQELLRFSSFGIIDSSFGVNGLVIRDVNSDMSFVNCLTMASGGKILAGGYVTSQLDSFSVTRFNPDGMPDPGFGEGGTEIGIYPAKSVSYSNVFYQSNGKLMAVGQITDGIHDSPTISRLNVNGSPDKSYGQGGTAYLVANNPQLQSDNKMLSASEVDTTNGFQILLSRYTASGSLDPTYGIAGRVLLDFGNTQVSVLPTAIQKDNKLIVAGGIQNSVGEDFLVARINADGTMDSSFGNKGFVTTDLSYYDFVQEIAVGPDGRILVGGYSITYSFALVAAYAMYKSNGSLDSSFGQNGELLINSGTGSFSGNVAIQKDGKALISYESTLTDSTGYVCIINRYIITGTLDSSFGAGGSVLTIGPNSFLLQDDQKILVESRIYDDRNVQEFEFLRFTVNGIPDNTFGNDGRMINHLVPGDNVFNDFIESGTQLFVAGEANDPNSSGFIAKFIPSNAKMAIDTSAVISSFATADNDGLLILATPNPSTSAFSVYVKPGPTNQPITLCLLDLRGNLLQTVTQVQAGESVQIGKPTMATGVYFLQVFTGKSPKVIKLVKW